MTINRIMNLVIAIVLISLISLYFITQQSLSTNKAVMQREVKLAKAVEYLKDARYNVVQVQQFLTDMGATRGDDALPEAQASLQGALKNFDELAKIMPAYDAQIMILETQLETVFKVGKDMADAYIAQGTEAGNALMKGAGGLDEASAKLADEIEAIAVELSKRLEKNSADSLDSIGDSSRASLISSLISGVVIIGALWLLRRRVLPSLKALNNSLHNIASGEKDLTVRLDEKGNDELTSISRSFNVFIQGIQDLVVTQQVQSSELSAAGQQMSASSDKTRAGMQALERETLGIAEVVAEMQTTVRHVAESAEEAATAAKDSDNVAKEVESVVNGSVTSIQKLSEGVEKASRVMQALEKETSDVGGILDTIRDIADQTNLLALNAAIEAARAGDQGRGFAVVADEVRTLALRTQQSTEQIQAMITQLQQGSQNAVAVMMQSQQQAQQSVAQSLEAKNALAQITSSMTNISNMASGIASAMEQQTAAAQNIDGRIRSIKEEASSTTIMAEQSNVAATQVLTQANSLSSLISSFKVQQPA